MTSRITESTAEEAALTWLEGLGYTVVWGSPIAPGEAAGERMHCGRVVLERRLREAVERLNPAVPVEALDEALRKLM